MALSPINLFRPSENALTQILQGGTQSVAHVMDQAIQVGRDMSNKAMQQEQDLIGMRKFETSMAQRRGEDLQQNMEDAQRFARSAFESDRRYGMDTRQEARQGAQQLFAQGEATRRTDLAERGTVVAEGGLDLRKQEAATEEARRKQNDAYYASKYGNDQTPASPEQLLAPPPQAPAQGQTAPDLSQLYQRKRELTSDLSSAKDPRVKARIAAELGPVEAAIKTSATGNTEASQRAEESLQMRKTATAQRAAEDEAKTLVGDTGAFVRPTQWMAQKYKTDASGNLQGVPPAQMVEAQAYNKDPLTAEVNYALNQPNVESYVNPTGMQLTDAQKAKRRKLWEYAHKQTGSAPATSGAPAAAVSPVRDLGL